MKKTLVIILVVFVSIQLFAQKEKKVNLTTPNDSVSYALGLDIGRAMKRQEVSEINAEMMIKGYNAALSNTGILLDEDQTRAVLQKFFSEKQAKMVEKEKTDNEAKYADDIQAGKTFLAANSKKAGVMTTKSGLQYKIITDGTGPIPTAESKVKTHYKGTLIDGTVFDSSYDRGEPITFPVNGVIPGWTEALQLMKVGSKWELYIPSELAYGERDMGKIKPYSTLIFIVELLGIEE